MKAAVKFFVENYKLTIVISLFLFIYGIMGIKSMNAEKYPAVSIATATIVTYYDGASAEDIETQITKPIEDELSGVVGVKDIVSVSKSGLSYITVRVDMDNYDTRTVMDELQRKVDGTPGLPTDLREDPEFTEINSEEMPIYEIALVGPNENRERDKLADELIDILEDLKEVKEVTLKGDAERQFLVILDYNKLKEHHISVADVMSKIQTRNVNIPGGQIRKGDDEALLRVEGKIKNAEDLENFMIRSVFSGQEILLKDIAIVKDSQEEKRIYTRYNSDKATILTVVKKGGQDTLVMVSKLEEKLEEFKSGHLKGGVKLIAFDNQGEYVQAKLDVLSSNAATGLLMVVIFLFIFLPWRIAISASISLPLACMATFGVMPLFGMNLDSITILALIIAIGMLVDNSVVISESYTRYLEDGLPPKEAATRAVNELWGAITASAFTTIAAFLPMLVTKGIMGAFILVIPIIVTAALLFSLGESFFLLPMRLVLISSKFKKTEEKVGFYEKFQAKFEGLLRILVRMRYLALGVFFGIIFISLFFLGVANQFILFPAEETETYIARYDAPNGTQVVSTDKLGAKFASAIKEKLGDKVEKIVGFSGEQRNGANDAKGGDGANLGLLKIYVTDYVKYNVEYTEILKELRSIEAPYLKSFSFEEVVSGPPVGSAIDSKFRSNDTEAIDKMIMLVKADVEKIEGVKDLKIDDVIGEDEVFVNINFRQADRVGLTPKDIGDTVRMAISGRVASEVTLENKNVEINLRFNKKFREDVEDLKQLRVMNKSGDLIPLGTVAEFVRKKGTPQIKRYNNQRARSLVGNVDIEVITSEKVNAMIRESFAKHQADVKGVTLIQTGAAESSAESISSLIDAFSLAMLCIVALLVFMFNSFLKPIIVMTTIPLGLLGFSVAFYFHDRPVSFLALIGVIGLAGMIVNSGIVLISYIDQLVEEGEMSLDEILVKASSTRLKAVLVTSLTTISGLFPTAYGVGGSDAMLIPMTLAMAWGLTTGTILTLLWVPCAYGILNDFNQLVQKIVGTLSSSKKY